MELTALLLFSLTTICTIWLFIAIAVYFAPIIIAYIRKHKNILAITIMTIVIGWKPIGWLAALLWSLNSDIEIQEKN